MKKIKKQKEEIFSIIETQNFEARELLIPIEKSKGLDSKEYEKEWNKYMNRLVDRIFDYFEQSEL